jgi:predicted ATPase
LIEVLKTLINTVRPGQENSIVPILSTDRALFGFNPHLRKLLSEIQSISRYDLLINELRQEQPISNTFKVSQTGDNIPSVVKKFIKDQKAAWERIVRTMSNISPFFSSVTSKSLRAGKEYLVFKEIFEGRPIESWEASDGTLRALAILLSLESHKEGSTVLIEEPEHGLHPWAVKDLILHIKEVIELKNLQVIITTHSQQVLESINKEELLIAERNEEGTNFATIEDFMPNAEISMGEVGELWTRGLLKGVPSNF